MIVSTLSSSAISRIVSGVSAYRSIDVRAITFSALTFAR